MGITIISREMGLVDADQVLPGLFIGGYTALENIDLLNPQPKVVVSAAQGIPPQQHLKSPETLDVKHLPLVDTPTDWKKSSDTWRSVMALGRYIATQWAVGQPVLVVCHSGINRSALLVGVALRFLGFDGRAAVNILREKRGMTLIEKTFRDAVQQMTPPVTIPWDKSRFPAWKTSKTI